MIDEFDARVLLENNIRLRIRAINKQDGDASIKYRGAIETLQKVLEYDDFTIDCITHNIREQEEKRDNNKSKTYIDCQKCENYRNPDYSKCMECRE